MSSTKTMFLQILTPILLLLPLFISSSSGEAVNSSENVGVCVSKGGRSHQPYELEGKLPESADLEFKELNLCNVFHGKTCCSASSGMLSASLALQNLAAHGDASKDCLFWFELLECSICHPDVGVQSGPIRICASFCDSVFEACSDASFSSNTQVVVPCAPSNGTICEKASKLVTNGTAFCEAVGFTVLQGADDSVEEPCYGSKRVLVTAVESFKKTVRLQDLKNKLVMMNMQMCWSGSVFVLAIALVNMWVHQEEMERDARRLRRRNRIRRRFY
ncbi:folate-binding protein 1-like [Raphanus sativus]|uniref:Folate-binding protein 1-like n=1 Tax=Raphanus sativus TaxID=3726 RepID=A0A6J0JVR0_RAPSA|nr:folate-binding protein 1-like [Raphanus sativus]